MILKDYIVDSNNSLSLLTILLHCLHAEDHELHGKTKSQKWSIILQGM